MSHKRNEALRHVQHSMHHVIAAGEGSDRAPDSCKLCPYYRPDFKFRTCLYAHCPYKKQVNVFRSTPEKWDILYAGCDVYMVMQLRHDEKIFDERFASMRELHRRGKTPDPEHYEVTYYADLPAMWQDVPNNEILEELFQMFNLSRPQDFEGHSLSVSDVIALKRNGEVSVHYVDSIGFKDLQGFLDKQPERHSVLMNLKEKCDAPECNPTVCRKARDEHEL